MLDAAPDGLFDAVDVRRPRRKPRGQPARRLGAGPRRPDGDRAAAARRDRAHAGQAVQRVRRRRPRADRRSASSRRGRPPGCSPPPAPSRPRSSRHRCARTGRRRRSSPRCSGSPRCRSTTTSRECAFGEWDGYSFAEVEQAVAARAGTVAGLDGRRAALRRVLRRRAAPRRRARDRITKAYAGQTVVVVSHVTPIKALVRLALDAPAPGAVPHGAVGCVRNHHPLVGGRRRQPALLQRPGSRRPHPPLVIKHFWPLAKRPLLVIKHFWPLHQGPKVLDHEGEGGAAGSSSRVLVPEPSRDSQVHVSCSRTRPSGRTSTTDVQCPDDVVPSTLSCT